MKHTVAFGCFLLVFIMSKPTKIFATDRRRTPPLIEQCAVQWLSLLLDDQFNIAKNTSVAFAIKSNYEFNYIQYPSRLAFDFAAPSDNCPDVFSVGILNCLNQDRHGKCLPPISFSDEATKAAQHFVSSNRDMLRPYKLREPKYGQLAWRESFPGRKTASVNYGYWEPFENERKDAITQRISGAWGYEAKPWYCTKNNEDDDRRFDDEEWKATSKIGVGCSVFFKDNAMYFYTAVFFEHPTYK